MTNYSSRGFLGRSPSATSTHVAALALATLILIIVFELVTSNFVTTATARSLLTVTSIQVVIAAALAAAMIMRQIDLSIGSNLGLCAYVAASTMQLGLPPVLAPLIALAIGAALGYTNGLIITKFGVPAIIATLGTAFVYRGILALIAPHMSGLMVNASDVPEGVRDFGAWEFSGIGFNTIVAVCVVTAIAWAVKNTRWGCDVYAIGSNPEGARVAGISVDAQIRRTMMLVGATAGLGGYMYVLRYNNADLSTGFGLDFTIIAQVVVGGVALTGGSGSIWGAVFGVLIINVIGRGLTLTDLPEFWKTVVLGVAIVLTAALNETAKRRRRRRPPQHALVDSRAAS